MSLPVGKQVSEWQGGGISNVAIALFFTEHYLIVDCWVFFGNVVSPITTLNIQQSMFK
jgi:hypothetical protein